MNFNILRKNMVDSQLKPNKIINEDLINAFLKVPREIFVTKKNINQSYIDDNIDLSKRMLDQAKKKNIYNELIKEDIVTYLSNNYFDFDYFVSLDVFIYIGDLSNIFKLIKSWVFIFRFGGKEFVKINLL